MVVELIGDYVDEQTAAFSEWLADGLPGFVAALLVVAVGWQLSRRLPKHVENVVARKIERESILGVARRGTRVGVLVVAAVVAMGAAFGVTLSSFLFTATVVSVIAGIVLAPIASDVMGGVFLIGDEPYEIGDMIELVDTGEIGFVDEVTIRYTRITTLENSFLVMPNSEMRKRDVVNYSSGDTRMRQDLDLGITYESDLEVATDLMLEAAREHASVITTEAKIRIGRGEYDIHPRVFVREFGDHGIHLRLRYWLREPYNRVAVKNDVNRAIWRKFADEDVEVPYPHSHLVFDETSGVGKMELVDGENPETPS